ncbi:MAG: NnrU family protein [Rhizobiales bacterium]|nr:NnrU family protein [Hyphomicrobiales bacterium]
MNVLIAGLALFALPHMYSIVFSTHRDGVRAKLGNAYRGLYALISLVGLALIVWGYSQVRAGPEAADQLFIPGEWTRHAAMLLVLLAFISLASGKGYIAKWIAQPMSIGIGLWAVAHLLANGKRAAVYLFGTFLAVAILDIVFSVMRGKKKQFEPKIRSDIIAVAAGVAVYAVFLLGFHPYVLNLPIVR